MGPGNRMGLSIDFIMEHKTKEDGKENEQDLEHKFRDAIHSKKHC